LNGRGDEVRRKSRRNKKPSSKGKILRKFFNVYSIIISRNRVSYDMLYKPCFGGFL